MKEKFIFMGETEPGTLYYMIRIPGGSVTKGSSFPGFGDPEIYGYTLEDRLYTNMVRPNRVPPFVLEWQFVGARVSMQRAEYEDTRAVTENFVFSFSAAGKERLTVLYAAPLFILPSVEGMCLLLKRTTAISPERALGRDVGWVSGEIEFECRLSAGESVELRKPVEVYILADMAFHYLPVGPELPISHGEAKGDGSDG